MLQRTKAEQVVEVFNNFLMKYDTPLKYYKYGFKENVFSNLGLPVRNNYLKEISNYIIHNNNDIPTDKKTLLTLPGIGNYIASAYRSLHLNLRDYIIDSNVVRLYKRYFNINRKSELRRIKWFENFANIITPYKSFKEYNYGIIDFTRKVCKLKPLCNICYLKSRCIWFLS